MSVTEQGLRITLPVDHVARLADVLERVERLLLAPAVPADGLLTKQQVAALLGRTSVRKVERLMAAGQLKKVPHLGTRTTRFRRADVERLVADRENLPGRRRL